MTCIVGLVEDGVVYIGGDSAGCAGNEVICRTDPKVFRNGDFLMGFTSSFRMGQLLQYAFRPPPRYPDADVFEYMVTTFIDALRECLKNGGFAQTNNDAESGGTFLVGYQGRLFKVEVDYQVGETADSYQSCGCGDVYALGSLYTSTGEPEQRIKKALETAAYFSTGVRGPFKVLKLATAPTPDGGT